MTSLPDLSGNALFGLSEKVIVVTGRSVLHEHLVSELFLKEAERVWVS